MKVVFSALLFCAEQLAFTSCSSDNEISTTIEDEAVDDGTSSEEDTTTVADADFEATDWTTETHSKEADPDFDEVLEDHTVKRLDIVITEDRWQSMLGDMTNTYGAFDTATIQALYSSYSALVEPYAMIEEPGYSFLSNSSEFQAAISELNAHVAQRATAVNSYLNE